jgi:hypothetical protein
MAKFRLPEPEKLFKAPEWRLINDRAVKISDVVVASFDMGDVEDPDLYVAQPIYEWQQTDAGKWIMEHAVEQPFWHREATPWTMGYKYHIVARLKEPDELYWTLKWKNEQS